MFDAVCMNIRGKTPQLAGTKNYGMYLKMLSTKISLLQINNST